MGFPSGAGEAGRSTQAMYRIAQIVLTTNQSGMAFHVMEAARYEIKINCNSMDHSINQTMDIYRKVACIKSLVAVSMVVLEPRKIKYQGTGGQLHKTH